MRTSYRPFKILVFTLLTCLLNACDGGLFGTGDGRPVLVNGIDPAGNSGSGVNGSPVAPIEIGGDSVASTISFENLQIATTNPSPQINIINVSDRAVAITLEGITDALFTVPIESLTFSSAANLPLGESNLAVVDTTSNDEVFSIRPLNVGASTLTTLIVRNNDAQEIDVVALSSMAMSLTPTLAQIRIVQAMLLADDDAPALFSLQPAGDQPGGTEVNFTNISVSSASTASYQSINAGDYQLVDSLGRLGTEGLNLQVGKIYTLVILGSPERTLLLHEDDLLAQ